MSGFLVSMEGAVSQGIIWGIMVLGVYITYKILDIADLTAVSYTHLRDAEDGGGQAADP